MLLGPPQVFPHSMEHAELKTQRLYTGHANRIVSDWSRFEWYPATCLAQLEHCLASGLRCIRFEKIAIVGGDKIC